MIGVTGAVSIPQWIVILAFPSVVIGIFGRPPWPADRRRCEVPHGLLAPWPMPAQHRSRLGICGDDPRCHLALAPPTPGGIRQQEAA